MDTLINNEYFLEVARKGIPDFSPLSRDYIEWWAEQKKRCINGYSVGGKWMPGKLYFYVNFWNIERSKPGAKRKSMGLPTLRDVEWSFFPLFEKARGFSGFDATGMPQYNNQSKGFMLLTGRGMGKSNWGSVSTGHEYTFFSNNELVVSAEETKYTVPLLDKIKLGLNNLPGSMEFAGKKYASPFSHRRTKNDWSKAIWSGYIEKISGIEYTRGYRSRIIHRVFLDNPMACNGLRASLHVFEESGANSNLIACYNASNECWMDGSVQFGTPFLILTGGDMEKGTIDAQKMFYDPDTYNLITFRNDYENVDSKIAYFIPAQKGLNQFKDSEGNTEWKPATEYLEGRRKRKKAGTDKAAYYNELQYQPFVPKEAFLITTGNIFPIDLLQDQLEYVLTHRETLSLGQPGRLEWNTSGGLDWKIEGVNEPLDYPAKGNLDGCVVIWEHPQKENGAIPHGLYIAGTDPYNQDESEYSASVGSTFIFKRFWTPEKTFDWPVAEYTGRPSTEKVWCENVRKLLSYYNATTLYENEFKGLKQYFEYKHCLNLLYLQPGIIDDIVPESKVYRTYGIHMVSKIKRYAEIKLRDWLIEEYSPGKLNLTKIYSIPLLKELISYRDKGNFDRFISFALCILHDLDMYRVVVKAKEEYETDNYFDQGYKMDGRTIIWS